jgi:DNA polymerase-3 subunit beta
MKADFNRAALTEALGLLTTVVPGRTPKPILQCVRLKADKKEVCISATDLEVGINYLLSEVQVKEQGDVIIPASSITAIVRESVDEVLSLEAAEGRCEITGADSHFTIYGQEPNQYPDVPVFDGDADLKVALANLQAGIEQSIFATAKESSRYAINGVLWDMKSRVNLASSVDEKVAAAKVIVPGKTMSLLDKIGGGDKDIVSVKLVDNQIIMSCSNVVVSSNLVEGNFPKYDDIIPKNYDKKLKLSTDAALSAVRRAALLTSEESRGIKLTISKGSLVFSGSAPETGDAQINMAIDYKAEPIEIGFNPHFLIDVLRVIKTPEFELELGEQDRPGLIKSGPNFIYVLMPINLG